jgi:hypothetical protein
MVSEIERKNERGERGGERGRLRERIKVNRCVDEKRIWREKRE